MLSPVLSFAFEIDQELQVEAQRALNLVAADGIAIAVERNGVIICRASAGEKAPAVGARLKRDSGITGECVRTSKAVYCADALDDPRVDANVSRQLQVRSIFVAPLRADGRVIGVLEALCAPPNALSQAKRDELQGLAAELEKLIAGPLASLERPAPKRELGIASLVKKAQAARESLPVNPNGDSKTEEHLQLVDAALSPTESGPSTFKADESVEVGPAPASCETDWKTGLPRRLAMTAIVLVINVGLVGLLWLLFSTGSGRGGVKAADGTPSPINAADSSQPATASNQPDADPRSIPEAAAPGTKAKPLDAQAVGLLKTWAQQGNARAQLQLAKALAKGDGVPRDVVAGYAWYIFSGLDDDELRGLPNQLSASQIGRVRLTLAQMFSDGAGGQPDLPTAYMWSQLAAAAGNRDAEAESRRIAEFLKPREVAQARERAQQWLARHRQADGQSLAISRQTRPE